MEEMILEKIIYITVTIIVTILYKKMLEEEVKYAKQLPNGAPVWSKNYEIITILNRNNTGLTGASVVLHADNESIFDDISDLLCKRYIIKTEEIPKTILIRDNYLMFLIIFGLLSILLLDFRLIFPYIISLSFCIAWKVKYYRTLLAIDSCAKSIRRFNRFVAYILPGTAIVANGIYLMVGAIPSVFICGGIIGAISYIRSKY